MQSAASKRSSNSVLATPVKDSRWMVSSDRKRTARSAASNTLCRSTSVCRRGRDSRSGHLAGISQRHVVRTGKPEIWTCVTEARMAEPHLKEGSTDPAVRDLQEALKALGYNSGSIEGMLERRPRLLLRRFSKQ